MTIRNRIKTMGPAPLVPSLAATIAAFAAIAREPLPAWALLILLILLQPFRLQPRVNPFGRWS